MRKQTTGSRLLSLRPQTHFNQQQVVDEKKRKKRANNSGTLLPLQQALTGYSRSLGTRNKTINNYVQIILQSPELNLSFSLGRTIGGLNTSVYSLGFSGKVTVRSGSGPGCCNSDMS